MNVQDIIKKVKELVEEGNLEAASKFMEEHKEDLGDQFGKVQSLIGTSNEEGVAGKVRGFFNK